MHRSQSTIGAERDILAIVGGGPAGLTTALALNHFAPHLRDRIVVLERCRYPRDKICAGAIAARGWLTLRSIGVELDVPRVKVDGFAFRGVWGAQHVHTDRAVGFVVRRLEFDAALAQAAKDAGICVREGVRVQDVHDDGRAVSIVTDSGTIRASVVVGADGVGSVVRRRIESAHRYTGVKAQVAEVDTDRSASDPSHPVLAFDVRHTGMAGYEWHFPTIVDGRPRVCRGMYSIGAWSRGRVDPAERLRARLAELGVSPDGPIKRFAERGYVPDAALASGRRMLVGEAAGIDPITGEGIAPGLAAGVLAGGFLAAVCRGESTIDDWTTVFRRSTVGLDLAIRSRAARLFYGRPRPFMDALLTRTRLPLLLASSYFSGEWWNTRRS